MTVTAHLEQLKVKHRGLEALIADEAKRPHPDENQIAQWKKEKLKVKEEISRLERH
jgi:hypothetical protein